MVTKMVANRSFRNAAVYSRPKRRVEPRCSKQKMLLELTYQPPEFGKSLVLWFPRVEDGGYVSVAVEQEHG